jgi:hypothetical protein
VIRKPLRASEMIEAGHAIGTLLRILRSRSCDPDWNGGKHAEELIRLAGHLDLGDYSDILKRKSNGSSAEKK